MRITTCLFILLAPLFASAQTDTTIYGDYMNEQFLLKLDSDSTYYFKKQDELVLEDIMGDVKINTDTFILYSKRKMNTIDLMIKPIDAFNYGVFYYDKMIRNQYGELPFVYHLTKTYDEVGNPTGTLGSIAEYDGIERLIKFEWIYLDADGNVEKTVMFELGKLHGQEASFRWINGMQHIAHIGSWSEGEKHGKWVYYSETKPNQIVKEVKYKKGEVVKEKVY